MRSGSAVPGLVLATLVSACAGGAPPSSEAPASVEGDELGATRASREAAHDERAATSAEAAHAELAAPSDETAHAGPSATSTEAGRAEPAATSTGEADPEPSATSTGEAEPEPSATFTVTSLGAVLDAEDGLGARVATTDAVAVDLDARRFRPRALDPVLEVGALRFVHYQHPEPGVLRFVLADATVLERGEPIAIQYGEDARSRVVLTRGATDDGAGRATGAVVP